MPRTLPGLLIALAACAVANADDRADLRFGAQDAPRQATEAPAEMPIDPAPARFGEQSDEIWFTYGFAGGAVIGRDAQFAEPYIAFSNFIADGFEFGAEFGGWYLAQDVGDDTFGGSVSLVFRWHFWESGEDRDWTIFASAAAGMLFTGEELAGDGNRYNFLPTGGLGFTHRLGDGANRLVGGVRWQHISNARLGGGDENPGRDFATFYLGVTMPF
jgi:hypothetical protein